MTGEPLVGASGDGGITPPEFFAPTLREVMLRPRWLAMLALCLVVAGVFAWLGQWQLGRAISAATVPEGATEEVLPIADVVAPSEYLDGPLVGQRVTATGTWVLGDFIVVQSRFNDGVEGYWVTGQFRIASPTGDPDHAPTSVAVAIGWAPTLAAAQQAVQSLQAGAEASGGSGPPFAVAGRIISDEGPVLPPPGADPFTLTRMSPAALLSRWHDIDGLEVYRPYLASQDAPAGLVDISSPAPVDGSNVNWLNIFYAIEWAVFAAFAFYLWYRLARDAREREIEELEDAAAAAGGASGFAAGGAEVDAGAAGVDADPAAGPTVDAGAAGVEAEAGADREPGPEASAH